MFKDNNVEEGYPRPISDFGLPPGGVDAAFSWAHNDKTYFFKDQLYWRYDEHTRRMDPGHPAQSPPWRGIPSTLDDAMRWSDGEPGTGGRATPGQPQPPHLGSWDRSMFVKGQENVSFLQELKSCSLNSHLPIGQGPHFFHPRDHTAETQYFLVFAI